MDDLVDDLTKIPLSGEDLIDIVSSLGKNRDEMKWTTYQDLHKFKSLAELFETIDTMFILITPPMENIGHWVCLGFNGEGIYYYDPYGLSIQEDIKITRSDDVLLQLLMGRDVDVNTFKHQKFGTNKGDEINTCGRHIATRSFFGYLSNKDYNDRVIAPLINRKEVKNADTVVNLLTAFLSNSDKVVETFFMGGNRLAM